MKANRYYVHSLHVRHADCMTVSFCYDFLLMPLYRVKILVKISPVVSAENILIKIALCCHVVVRRILSNISRCTGPNFAIFSPYESTLRADDKSVLYFPICQGTLSWQPNDIAEMKANRYYVHSLHVPQMGARFRFATTCY